MTYRLPPFTLRVFPHCLQFKQPAGTSRGVYRRRQVWYVAVRSISSARPFVGIGECAPLYDLSCDFDADYESKLKNICREVEAGHSFSPEKYRDLPSICFGLETAFLSAQASIKGDARLLFPSDFTEGRRRIAINGLVWMGRFDEMCRRMEEKLAAGFRCVKLKIGAIAFEEEMALIRQLRSRFSPQDVELRVDANGGFTFEEAPRILEILSRYAIHSVEQPIRQGRWQQMARLCATTPLPIALDEELIGVNRPEEKRALLDTIRPQYIILKPSLHGGLFGAEEWIRMARERQIGYWTTSALESNVGLNAIAQWSAAFDPDSLLPQGLGTGQLFVSNYKGASIRIEGDSLCYGDERQRNFQREVREFMARWNDERPTLTVHTSGSTGMPKAMEVEKSRMKASAQMTIEALGLRPGMSALLAMPLRFIAGQMVVVRSIVGGLHLIPVAPSSHPYARLCQAPDFAALTPMQVYESLRVPHERSLLRRTRLLLIGGGAISPELAEELKTFPHAVWSTYGMTETLSHIALRRQNGPEASDCYRPLPSVKVSLSEFGTLTINAPLVNPERLVTNDLAELLPDGAFRILGRRDNTICSGGIKLQIEAIEAKLTTLPVSYQITAVGDERLSETVTLLYEGSPDDAPQLAARCRELLSPYEVPRHYLPIEKLPHTATGKPARKLAREIAESLMPHD